MNLISKFFNSGAKIEFIFQLPSIKVHKMKIKFLLFAENAKCNHYNHIVTEKTNPHVFLAEKCLKNDDLYGNNTTFCLCGGSTFAVK